MHIQRTKSCTDCTTVKPVSPLSFTFYSILIDFYSIILSFLHSVFTREFSCSLGHFKDRLKVGTLCTGWLQARSLSLTDPVSLACPRHPGLWQVSRLWDSLCGIETGTDSECVCGGSSCNLAQGRGAKPTLGLCCLDTHNEGQGSPEARWPTLLLITAVREINDQFQISLQPTYHHINTDTQGLFTCCRHGTRSCWSVIDSCSLTFSLQHKCTLRCRASSSPSLTWRIYNAALDHLWALRSTFTCHSTDWVGRCGPRLGPRFYLDIKSNKARVIGAFCC